MHYAYDKEEWFVALGEDGQGYESGGTLERRFEEKTTESEIWDTANLHNTELGFASGLAENKLGKELDRSLSYVLYDMNGQHLSTFRPTVKFNNISYEFNVSTIRNIAKGARYLGRGSTGISCLMTGYEIYQGQKKFFGEGGLDLLMTGVGMYGLGGLAISGTYFIGKYLLEETNSDFWNK